MSSREEGSELYSSSSGFGSIQTTSSGGFYSESISSFCEWQDLRNHFRDRIIRDVPVHEFVHCVWRFDTSLIRMRLPGQVTITISASLLKFYSMGLSSEYNAPGLYPDSGMAICKILRSIHGQLEDHRPAFIRPDFFRRPGVSGPHSPTIGYSLLASDDWDMLGAFIHVSKSEVIDYGVEDDIDIPVGQQQMPFLPPLFATSSSFAEDSSPSELELSPTNEARLSKPERQALEIARRYAIDPKPLSGAETIPARYINKMMSHGVRAYASGVAVQGRNVTLYHEDRFGLIKSVNFDVIDNLDLLVLVVAALIGANSAELGMSPLLHIPDISIGLQGSKIKFPIAFDIYGEKDKDPWRFKVHMSDYRPLFAARGTVGRGTTVIPVRQLSKNGKKNPVNTGRKKLVCKMSWPHKHLDPEDKLIRGIREALGEKKPHMLKYVVKLLCSTGGTIRDVNLPRAFIDRNEGDADRVFRAMVLHAYHPIVELSTASDFEQVSIDVVKAHHWVYEVAEVLHRDISHNNVMSYLNAGRVVGVLCDFDLSRGKKAICAEENNDASIFQRIQQGENLPLPDHKYEAVGTKHFMATELLSLSQVPVRTYRHDLESIFFLLCWFCAVHDPVRHTFGSIPEWQDQGYIQVGQAKSEFLATWSSDIAVDTLFANAHDEYRGLVEKWVKPLRGLFIPSGVKLITVGLEMKRDDGSITARELRDLKELHKLLPMCDESTFLEFMEHIQVSVDGQW